LDASEAFADLHERLLYRRSAAATSLGRLSRGSSGSRTLVLAARRALSA